jgi:hypothetical protein
MGSARSDYLEARSGILFVRHGPFLPLVIRADERRRTKRSDRVSRDPNGGLAVGFAQEWPLVSIMRPSEGWQ